MELANTGEGRIRRALADGWRLLATGRNGEAADLFGRVLLQDGGSDEARRGLLKAQEAAGEESRLHDSLVERAQSALDRGHARQARVLLEDALTAGDGSDRAMALADRLDDRAGLLGEGMVVSHSPPLPDSAEPVPRGSRFRRLLVLVWAVGFAFVAATVVSSWELLMQELVRAPEPSTRPAPPPTGLAAPTPGERAVGEARRLMERGDLAAAVTVLDQILPEEPAYPSARRLRREAERALVERGYAE